MSVRSCIITPYVLVFHNGVFFIYAIVRMRLCVLSPLHALHQRHLIRRGGDVEGRRFSLVDSLLNAVHRLLLLHLHRVTQA